MPISLKRLRTRTTISDNREIERAIEETVRHLKEAVPHENPLMNIKEVVAKYEISTRTLYRLQSVGHIKPFNKKWRMNWYRKTEIGSLMNELGVQLRESDS